ncbi:hypothetical protein B0H19DRAFT_1057638 [Mycena capillaripes]|nr:hypothetical protein B0H19DRAFT_1057638 [Mycena capillaripes]
MFKFTVLLIFALVAVAIAGPVTLKYATARSRRGDVQEARQIDGVTWVNVVAGTTIQWARRALPTPAVQARQIDAVTWVDLVAGTTIQWAGRALPTPAARDIDAVTWVDVEAGTTIQW